MKYVLVTGAYGGMGKQVVKSLCDAGFTVFALDKQVEATESFGCDKAGESLASNQVNQSIIPVQADLTDPDSVNKALQTVCKTTDSLYAILHFAGIYALDSLVEMSEDKLKRVFDVNFFGAYRVNKAFLPLLKKGSRIIIATSELAPLEPLPFTGVYAISKSTLDKYAFSLRMELQLLGISVSVLRPGAVDTGMLDVSTEQLDGFCKRTELYPFNAKRFKQIVERVEARRVQASKVARKTLKILREKKPKQVYKLNRNPLLLLLNALPKVCQTRIIKSVLKNK